MAFLPLKNTYNGVLIANMHAMRTVI